MVHQAPDGQRRWGAFLFYPHWTPELCLQNPGVWGGAPAINPFSTHEFCRRPFPKEIETVVFKTQSVSLRCVKAFVGAQGIDESEESWDVSVQQTCDENLKQNLKVETSSEKAALRFFRYVAPARAGKGKKRSTFARSVERLLRRVTSANETLLLSLPRYMHTSEFAAIVEDMIRGET